MEIINETYAQLHARHQKELDDFPMFFAFSNRQFDKGMRNFGLSPDDTEKICKLGNTGGYILRTDAERIFAMSERHGQELTDAMKDMDFAVGAFRYQLNNHEYCVTHDRFDAIDALELTDGDLANNKMLNAAFNKAEKQYWSDYRARGSGKDQPRPTMLDKVAKNQEKVDAYKEANPPGSDKDRGKSGKRPDRGG